MADEKTFILYFPTGLFEQKDATDLLFQTSSSNPPKS